jgi:predicted AAA+ superfamily ATPase
MYYSRHIEAVVRRIAKRKPVIVLTGSRQVGKSTMLKTVFEGLDYIALDNPLVRQSAQENPSVFFDIYRPPVIVDEIQKAAQLFDYIKERVDADKIKGQFYLTGSQSMRLMKNISDSLAGRAGVIKLLGLSMRELDGWAYQAPFLPTSGHFENVAEESGCFEYEKIVTRIHKGFFPELYEEESDLRDWADFYSSYFQTYIEKDVKDTLHIQDESAFIRFIRATAALTGQMLNISTLAEACGKDVKTAGKWLSVLESSGLVYLLEPYFNNHNKRLTKTPKLHFLDTGLACWLLGWNTPEQLASGAMWGHIFESFVFVEVLKSYYNDGIVRPPLFYFRDKDKNEIDLLIQDGTTLYPVEIKAGSDPAPSAVSAFKSIERIPGVSRGSGAVICMAKDRLPLTPTDAILPVRMV